MSAPPPHAHSRLQPSGAVGLCSKGSVSPWPRRRVSWAQSLKAAAGPASQAPVLASEPARCDSGKSRKETDDVEKLATKPGRAAFWALRQMETLRNQAANQQTSNKRRVLQQQHHHEGKAQVRHVLFVGISIFS